VKIQGKDEVGLVRARPIKFPWIKLPNGRATLPRAEDLGMTMIMAGAVLSVRGWGGDGAGVQ
jgi:hypothetical protein